MSLTFTVQLTMVQCASCSLPFGITADFESRRRKDHARFYCPSGHFNVFTGETEEEKKIKQLERRIEIRDGQLDHARNEADYQKRQAAAAKGQLTRMRNRVARGVCPQAGCKRSFTNLHDHVASEHPTLLEAVDA